MGTEPTTKPLPAFKFQTLETADMFREQKWILLDPTSKTYQRIDTSISPLLISVKNLTPYLDGYKVNLEIGNPYSMDLVGFQVSYNWGVPYKYLNGAIINYAEVQSSEKSKVAEQTDVLRAGWWNQVELTVTPATSEEIQNLRISITPNTVSLYRKNENQP